jgi:hypothetical protein
LEGGGGDWGRVGSGSDPTLATVTKATAFQSVVNEISEAGRIAAARLFVCVGGAAAGGGALCGARSLGGRCAAVGVRRSTLPTDRSPDLAARNRLIYGRVKSRAEIFLSFRSGSHYWRTWRG